MRFHVGTNSGNFKFHLTLVFYTAPIAQLTYNGYMVI